MRNRVLVAASLASLLAGCLDVGTDASVDLTEDISWDLGDGVASCAGTRTNAGTTTVYTRQTDGSCRLDITWAGTFLDVAKVKDSIKKNVDGYPDDVTVTVTGLRAEFTHINLTDASGADVTPAVTPHFDAALIVGGHPTASFSGDNLAALLAQVTTIDLGALVDPTNNALDTNVNLPGTGTAVIILPASGTPGRYLNFHAGLHFDVHGERGLLSFL